MILSQQATTAINSIQLKSSRAWASASLMTILSNAGYETQVLQCDVAAAAASAGRLEDQALAALLVLPGCSPYTWHKMCS